MEKVWEDSPEWQGKQELLEALEKAREAKDEAGLDVLVCVRGGLLSGPTWERDRRAYLLAQEAYEDAYVAWDEASKTFRASPAGRAFARFFADPLATEAEEVAA